MWENARICHVIICLVISKYITFFPKHFLQKFNVLYQDWWNLSKWQNCSWIKNVKIIDVDTFLINFKKCIDINLSQKTMKNYYMINPKSRNQLKKWEYQNKNVSFQNSVHDIEEKMNDFKRVFKKQIWILYRVKIILISEIAKIQKRFT